MLVLLMRISKSRFARTLARCYIELFHGTPLLMQLFLIFFGVALLGIDISPWMAAPSTDPLFTIGLLGSYSKFKFEGGRESEKEDVGQGGVFANFGNKMTAESGFIYQIGGEAGVGAWGGHHCQGGAEQREGTGVTQQFCSKH